MLHGNEDWQGAIKIVRLERGEVSGVWKRYMRSQKYGGGAAPFFVWLGAFFVRTTCLERNYCAPRRSLRRSYINRLNGETIQKGSSQHFVLYQEHFHQKWPAIAYLLRSRQSVVQSISSPFKPYHRLYRRKIKKGKIPMRIWASSMQRYLALISLQMTRFERIERQTRKSIHCL